MPDPSVDPSASIAIAVAEAATALDQSSTLEETLDAIVAVAARSVPGFEHAGVSILHNDGRIETTAGTDQLVWELDALQYDLNEGPCVDAIREEGVVVVEHARHTQRWPNFIPRAAQAGLRSQLGLRLYVDGATIGGLNLYSTQSETITEDAILTGELFATHAAIALGHSRTESNLTEGMKHRQLVGQAIGLLMCRYEMDEQRAFQFLVRTSSTSQIKLRDVAQEIVTAANETYAAKTDPTNSR